MSPLEEQERAVTYADIEEAARGKLEARGKRVGIVLSGGNADVKRLCALS